MARSDQAGSCHMVQTTDRCDPMILPQGAPRRPIPSEPLSKDAISRKCASIAALPADTRERAAVLKS